MLLVVFGPPAVGKMTVGRAICAASDFGLFHNHMTIEPLIEAFGWGTPAFNTLNAEFRRRVLEEAARHHCNLVFSVVWALDDADDLATMHGYLAAFDGEVAFVELRAGLDTRLARNRTEHRLAEKRSKRDLDWSDANVREMEQEFQMTSERPSIADEVLDAHPHLVLDNTGLAPEDAAHTVLDWVATLAPTA